MAFSHVFKIFDGFFFFNLFWDQKKYPCVGKERIQCISFLEWYSEAGNPALVLRCPNSAKTKS